MDGFSRPETEGFVYSTIDFNPPGNTLLFTLASLGIRHWDPLKCVQQGRSRRLRIFILFCVFFSRGSSLLSPIVVGCIVVRKLSLGGASRPHSGESSKESKVVYTTFCMPERPRIQFSVFGHFGSPRGSWAPQCDDSSAFFASDRPPRGKHKKCSTFLPSSWNHLPPKPTKVGPFSHTVQAF